MLFDWEQVTPCFSSSFFFFWNTLTFNYQTVFLVFVIITIIIVIIFLCLTSAPILVSVAPVFVFKHSCPSFSEFALQEKQAPLFPPDPNTLSGGFFFFHFCSRVVFPSTFIFSLHTHGREKLKKKKKRKGKESFFFLLRFPVSFLFFFSSSERLWIQSLFFFLFFLTLAPRLHVRGNTSTSNKRNTQL